MRSALQAAEQTGLQPKHFDQSLVLYLHPAYQASARGYGAAFLAVTAIALVGALSTGVLVRRPKRGCEPSELDVTSPRN